MARKKTTEDLLWDKIFSTISFEIEPPAKYITDATIFTKTGKKIRVNGQEFSNIMEQERMVDPEETIIESCKIKIDFEKIKEDVNKFAIGAIKKSCRRYRKSRQQLSTQAKLKNINSINLDKLS